MAMRNSSYVHTVETSGTTPVVRPYRDVIKQHCRVELTATEELYAHFDNLEGKNRVESLLECRSRAWFVRNRTDGSVRVAANSCRLRWCPLCSKSRQNYIRHEVSAWFRYADHPKFLTVTIKHSQQPLTDQMDRIYKAFRALRKNKFFKARCSGGVWFFQICWNPERHEWHPHIHAIITGEYLDYKRLRSIWLFYTGDSEILDIRQVKDPRKVADYVARYAARPCELSDLPNRQAIEAMSSLYGRRLAGCFGSARSISLRPRRIPDPENWEYMGNWRIIHHLAGYDDKARAILYAYHNKEKLGDGFSCYDYEVFLDGKGSIEKEALDIDPEPPPQLF